MIYSLMKRGVGGLTLVALWLLILAVRPASAQPQVGEEYRVKAGFIYHFVRFTQWPPEAFDGPDSPIVICVASTRPGIRALFSLAGKIIRKREIVVRPYDDAEVAPCHLLFISSADDQYVLSQLAAIRDRSILTVGENGAFTKMGGIISFFEKDKRLRFGVNREAARRAGLKFSAQLLMSAEIVQEGR